MKIMSKMETYQENLAWIGLTIAFLFRIVLLGLAYITVRPLLKSLGLKRQLVWVQRKISGGYDHYTDEQYEKTGESWTR